MIKLQKKAGVTLIELLIVLALFPLVLVALGWVFAAVTEGQLRSIAQSSVDQEQQFILSKLSSDVARAEALLMPATPGASGAVLQMELPDGLVQYSLSGTRLMRTDSLTTAAVSSSRVLVDEFSVTRLGSPSGFPSARVTMSLSSTGSAQLDLLDRETTTTFGFRVKP